MSPHRATRSRAPYAATALAALAMLATACNIEPLGSSLDLAGGGLTGISVSGSNVVAVGGTAGLEATGTVSGLLGMFSYDPLDDAVWSTANPRIATVVPREPQAGESQAARAIVTGVAPGQTTITVSARGFSATWPMLVRADTPR